MLQVNVSWASQHEGGQESIYPAHLAADSQKFKHPC